MQNYALFFCTLLTFYGTTHAAAHMHHLQLPTSTATAQETDASIRRFFLEVEANNAHAVAKALEDDIEANAKYGPLRRTALMCAALNGFSDIVTILLTYKADVGLADSQGATALHLCAQNLSAAKTPITMALLNEDASPLEPDNFGWNPLMQAAYHRNISVLNLLLEHLKREDKNCLPMWLKGKNDQGETIMHCLIHGAISQHFNVTEELEQAAYTAIEDAVKHTTWCIDSLVAAGADINAENNKNGRMITPRDLLASEILIAEQNQQPSRLEYLRRIEGHLVYNGALYAHERTTTSRVTPPRVQRIPQRRRRSRSRSRSRSRDL